MKPLTPNTTLQDRYKITEMIGKGGMGEVYLAIDQRLGHSVALKRTTVGDDQYLAEAFEREARTLAQLRHGVLPKVSDHFIENNEQFLIMEYISGEDLSERIKSTNKAFPLNWVMFWADQLLDALTYLHTHTPPIIHRDIKPQNLKLTSENHIVLLDFGLSKNTQEKTQVTTSGSVVGYTPHYASMEQIRGTGTNARSDIFSLSATLYQLATNVIPPDALTRADAMLSGMADPIKSPSELNPEISEKISNAILKGMEISQEKRFVSAREMQKAMRRAFNDYQKSMSAETVAFNASDLESSTNEDFADGEKTEMMPDFFVQNVESSQDEVLSKDTTAQTDQENDLDPTLIGGYRPDSFDGAAETEIVNANELKEVLPTEDPNKTEQYFGQVSELPTDKTVAIDNDELSIAEASAEDSFNDLKTEEDIPAVIPTDPNLNINETMASNRVSAYDFDSNKIVDEDLGLSSQTDETNYTEHHNADSTAAGVGLTNNFENVQEIDVEEASENEAVAGSGVVNETNARQTPPKQKSSTGKYVALLGGLGIVLVILLGTALAVGLYYTNGDFGFGGDETETETKTESVPNEEPIEDATEPVVPKDDSENADETAENTEDTEDTTDAENQEDDTTSDETTATDNKDETTPAVNNSKKTTTKKTTSTTKTQTTKKPPVKTTKKQTTKKPPKKTTKPPVKKKKKKDAGVL